MDSVDPVQPWWNRIPAILAYPFSTGGLIALVTMTFAAFLQAISRFGPAGIMGKLIGSGLHARFQSACASRDLAAIGRSAPLLADAYWQAGNPLGATQVFRAVMGASPDTPLGAERLARLAKDLEQQEGDLQSAMIAWRTLALQNPDHARAPSALWRCAEICVKLQRLDWAASACQAILARYPMSEVAPLAQQRLKSLAPKS